MTTISVRIADITVGKRSRRNNGDLTSLAASIDRLGLLHPIGLNGKRELIFGGRRLAACKSLGWADVPATILTTLDGAADALRAERDENTCREQPAPTELVELGRAIEALERPEAAKRQQSTQAKPGERVGDVGGGKLPPPENKGKTREKVGEALGISGSTYEKAKRVMEAAEVAPEVFGDLPEMMDEESIDAAHKELKARSEAAPNPQPKYMPRDRRPGKPPPRPDYEGQVGKVMALLQQTATALTKLVRDEDDATSIKFLKALEDLKLPWVRHHWCEGSELDPDTGEVVPMDTPGPAFVALRPLRRLLALCYKNRRFSIKQLQNYMSEENANILDLNFPSEEEPAHG